MENWNKNINNLNESIQINVIEINIKKSEIINSKYINYFYLDSSNLPDFYKNNNALAYNIIIKLLKLYNFDFNFFYFDLLDFNIDKEIVYDINGFDEYNIDFINNFQNKINLYNSKEKSDEIKILFNYLKYKDNINLNIFDNIKTVIINLDERKDRLLYTWEECKKINLNNFERFAGIKIKEINKPLIDNNKAWKKNNIEYLKSATGCKLSHLELLKKYKNCSEDYIMILEDDIIFEENTIIFLNLALIELQDKDWDILYLGSNLIEKEDAVRVGINILEIKNGLTTTAQIFKKSKIDFIIKLIEESDTEIDNTYNLLNNKYSVYPMCVYQRESYSDINKKNMDYGKFHKKFKY
jgi:GR25 family glycosyltransferase involved in LPS biosynthesis